MKKLASTLLSKLVICSVMILLQLGWFVFLLYRASARYSFFNILIHALAIAISIYVVNREMKPYNKLSWVFIILCLPIIGITCYFFFGRSDLAKFNKKRYQKIVNFMDEQRVQKQETLQFLQNTDRTAYKQAYYIHQNAGYPMYIGNKTRYYKNGESMFADMLLDLQQAKKFIFLEYFIIENGIMFDSIIKILEEKAKQGVHIRLIYDDFGCIKTLKPKYYKELQKKGIHCASFNPFRPALSIIMNNRDHKKILVIDGKVSYTGGVNLADEYINKKNRFGYWKDAGIRIEGDATNSFTTMFLETWNYIVGGMESCERFMGDFSNRPNGTIEEIIQKEGLVQPYADSPLDNETVGENIYINLINQSQKYVYIFTPYLIIGPEMITALINAAKCGVDVRIVTPGIPDKKSVFLLSQSFYRQLLDGGVKIYEYTPGFMHAKCFVSDDKYATVGTINLDYRSLYLHFECGTFLYQTQSVMEIKKDAMDTFEQCRRITLEFCKSRNVFIRLIQSILHLFVPLL